MEFMPKDVSARVATKYTYRYLQIVNYYNIIFNYMR